MDRFNPTLAGGRCRGLRHGSQRAGECGGHCGEFARVSDRARSQRTASIPEQHDFTSPPERAPRSNMPLSLSSCDRSCDVTRLRLTLLRGASTVAAMRITLAVLACTLLVADAQAQWLNY